MIITALFLDTTLLIDEATEIISTLIIILIKIHFTGDLRIKIICNSFNCVIVNKSTCCNTSSTLDISAPPHFSNLQNCSPTHNLNSIKMAHPLYFHINFYGHQKE